MITVLSKGSFITYHLYFFLHMLIVLRKTILVLPNAHEGCTGCCFLCGHTHVEPMCLRGPPHPQESRIFLRTSRKHHILYSPWVPFLRLCPASKISGGKLSLGFQETSCTVICIQENQGNIYYKIKQNKTFCSTTLAFTILLFFPYIEN